MVKNVIFFSGAFEVLKNNLQISLTSPILSVFGKMLLSGEEGFCLACCLIQAMARAGLHICLLT